MLTTPQVREEVFSYVALFFLASYGLDTRPKRFRAKDVRTTNY